MNGFRRFLNSPRLRHRKAIIELFALLGYKLNSYYSFRETVSNLLTGQAEDVVIYSQFVPSQMKHPSEDLQVGYWRVSRDILMRLPCVAEAQFYGNAVQDGFVDFYFPLDLTPEYPGLTDQLGAPTEILRGLLTPSGRSIWVLADNRDPVCIKIDTMQLEKRRYFSERALIPAGVEHSIVVDDYLHTSPLTSTEDRGANITFHFKYTDGVSKRYTYLLREYDFKKLDIWKKDFLIPVVAILSPDLWSNPKLLKSMKITKPATEMLATDLAKCFADLIRNSLANSFVHFEVHQQNLTLHMRDGQGKKLIYHDLQDTVFDTISYLLVSIARSLDSGEGWAPLKRIYDQAAKFQGTNFLNAHGYILSEGIATHECFTITSLYRRYLRNFGSYNKSLNYFFRQNGQNVDYLSDKFFEAQILKFIAFAKDDLEIDEVAFGSGQEKEFLTKDLFWNIQRFHEVFQKRSLKRILEAVAQGSSELAIRELDPATFKSMLKMGVTGVASNGFPVSVDNIDSLLVTRVRGLYEDRILIVTYKGLDYLVARFF